MKVGFLIDRPPLYNGGFSQRIKREVELVSKNDNLEISLMVLYSLKELLGNNVKKKLEQQFKNLNIKEISLEFLLSTRLPINRRFFDRYYINKVKNFIRENNIEVLICENLWAAYIGSIASREEEIKCIFDYHGIVPEESVYEGLCTYDDKLYRYLKEIERVALANSNHIICVSNNFRQYLINRYSIDKTKIGVVPSCISDDKIAFNLESRKKLRDKYNLNNRKVIIYAGSIMKYQCIDEMIWIFSEIIKKDKDYFFIFLSAYDNYNELNSKFRKFGVSEENYMLNSVPHEEVYDFYSAADYGIIIRDDNLLNKVASPTKIAEYLSGGLPIISTFSTGDINTLESAKVLIDYKDITNRDLGMIENIIFQIDNLPKRSLNNKLCHEEISIKYFWDNYKNYYSSIINNKW